MEPKVLHAFGYRKGFLILQLVVGNGIVQMYQFPAIAAGSFRISSIEKITFHMFLQKELELRRRFQIGGHGVEPKVLAQRMGYPLLMGEDCGNHLVPGSNKETGHCIPSGSSHIGPSSRPGDIPGHEGKKQGDFVLFIIVMKDFLGAGEQEAFCVGHGNQSFFIYDKMDSLLHYIIWMVGAIWTSPFGA